MWRIIDTKTEKQVAWQNNDWPILIHGAPKAGSSFFTIALTVELIRQGKKVVFLCAKGEAIRSLQQELGLHLPEKKYDQLTSSSATALEKMQLVSLFKKRNTNMLESLRALKDWGERVVIIKNVEDVLTSELWATVKSHRQLMVSGDFEKMKFEIDPNAFPTVILFSPSPGHWHQQRSALPSYLGDVFQGSERFQTIIEETGESKK